MLSDDGWGDEGEPRFMVIRPAATDLQSGLDCTLDVVKNVHGMDNDLRTGCEVAIQRAETYEGVCPPDFAERFDPRAA